MEYDAGVEMATIGVDRRANTGGIDSDRRWTGTGTRRGRWRLRVYQ